MKNKTVRWKTDNNLYHMRFSNDGVNYFEIDAPFPSTEAMKNRLIEITSIIQEKGKFEVKSKTNNI